MELVDKDKLIELGWTYGVYPNCYNEDELEYGFSYPGEGEDSTYILHFLEHGDVGIVRQEIHSRVTGNWTAINIFKGEIVTVFEFNIVTGMLGITEKVPVH